MVAPKTRYAAITTALDSNGASAAPPNLRCACRTPVSTMPTPYRRTCGAKTRSIEAPTSTAPGQLLDPSSSAEIGSASTATATAIGVSSRTVQVSSAELIRPARSRSPAATARASSGTTRLARAPPATISKTMFGTVFTVW